MKEGNKERILGRRNEGQVEWKWNKKESEWSNKKEEEVETNSEY